MNLTCRLFKHKEIEKEFWINDCTPDNPSGVNKVPFSYKVKECERCKKQLSIPKQA
jgi:hypothetical protein